MNKLKSSTGNFKYALEGIVHVYRSQKHMRFHLLSLVLVGIFVLILKLNYIETLLIIFAISFVIVCEMINTAIEAVVDLFTQNYHPLAKFAKDIAAGATLVSALNACVIGIVIVINHNHAKDILSIVDVNKNNQLVLITIIGLFIMLAIIIMYKVAGNKGKIWKGGIISVHSAVGFFLAWTTFYIDNKIAIGIIALCLASLIAQSRVEGGIHTMGEVLWGALVASCIAFLIYILFRPLLP